MHEDDALDLTDEQVDMLLVRYDQTEPRLQRRIVAGLILKCAELEDAIDILRDRNSTSHD